MGWAGASPKGYIQAPSSGVANDTARARNMGRRTRMQTYAPQLMKSASEPSFGAQKPLVIFGASRGASSSLPESPKTPRTLRGCVRKVSKVTVLYPDIPSPSTAQSVSPGISRSSFKKVTFADDSPFEKAAVAEDRSELAIREAGLKRSMQMMGSLYNLRRAGWDKTEEAFEE